MSFSACWIVKNEADNIRSSIESVKDMVSEIVVVDTGSTDDTVNIAKACGAKVVHFQWIDDFSAAKNYALSQVAGDYVFLLDADERFSTPLTKDDHDAFRAIFEENDVDVLQFIRAECDKEDGSIFGQTNVDRAFRHSNIHFENKIHEVPRDADGNVPNGALISNYALLHTGYSKNILLDKVRRNIKILESEQVKLTDPVKLFVNAQYLLREYLALNNQAEACKYCRYLLDHMAYCKAASTLFYTGIMQRFFHALCVAAANRHLFAKREIYDKLVLTMADIFPHTQEAAVAPLYYQLLFHYRESAFLQDVTALEIALDTCQGPMIPECNHAKAKIFARAAEAAHIRQDYEKVKEWALFALRLMATPELRTVQLLLYAMKNDPPEDVYRFLEEQLNLKDPAVQNTVSAALNNENYRDVYQIFEKKGLAMMPYNPVVFGITGAKWDTKGQVRERLSQLFYLMHYSEIINETYAEDAAVQDLSCAYYIAVAWVMNEEYEKAYNILLPYIQNQVLDIKLLELLKVVEEKSEGSLKRKAGTLYTESIAILDEGVHLSDIINTNTVYGADTQEQKRAMKRMTPSAFLEAYEKDRLRPTTKELTEAHQRAVAVFERTGCVLMAAASYRFLLAKGDKPKQNAANLIRLFADCGNKAVAERIKALTSHLETYETA